MQYRILGKTGLRVSTLGFGCMRLPTAQGADRNAPVDEAATVRLVARALELGINYFDTAYPYHLKTSEGALGKALEAAKARHEAVVVTKMPGLCFEAPETWDALFAEQCEKLRTEYVDVYLIHALTRVRWKQFLENGGIEFITRLQREGRVKHLGFSFHDDLPTFMNILDGYDWEVCQIQFNYMDTHFQAGLAGYEEALRRNMGVVSMETLKGGSLARRPPEAIQAIWDASGRNWTPADWAMRWVLDHPGIATALSGMHLDSELEANALAAEHSPESLTEADHAAIGKVRDLYAAANKVACTACNYCMPCPAGVNIPNAFMIYNHLGLFGDTEWANGQYNIMGKANNNRADLCVACGACEEQCPQSIGIIEKLKEAHTSLEALRS